MSIRLLAIDLYRLTREVERLERELEAAPPSRRDAIAGQLARARTERDRMRQALDGQKDGGRKERTFSRERR